MRDFERNKRAIMQFCARSQNTEQWQGVQIDIDTANERVYCAVPNAVRPITDLVIPDGVTHLRGLPAWVRNVTLPDSCKVICKDCANFEKGYLSSGMVSIVGNGVEVIEECGLYHLTDLSNAEFPQLRVIHKFGMADVGVSSLSLPKAEVLGVAAITGSSLKRLLLGNVQRLGHESVILRGNVDSVTLQSSQHFVYDYASISVNFEKNGHLEHLYMPEDLEFIQSAYADRPFCSGFGSVSVLHCYAVSAAYINHYMKQMRVKVQQYAYLG